MEHLSLKSIITAQKDLEKRIIEQRNYEGKSAALRLLGFSCGTAAIAFGLRYITGETFYTTIVPSLFGFAFLCGPNLIGISNYFADLSLGEKPIVDEFVNIDDEGVVRINKLAPKVEYNPSRLKNEPEKYLDEQITYLQNPKAFFEKGHDEVTQDVTKLLSLESYTHDLERFQLDDLIKLEKLYYKIYYNLFYLIRGKTNRSSMYKYILEEKTILSKLQLIEAAFNYGMDFYSKAKTQPELKQFTEKIDNCLVLCTESQWFMNDTIFREQQKISVLERFYAENFS